MFLLHNFVVICGASFYECPVFKYLQQKIPNNCTITRDSKVTNKYLFANGVNFFI